MSALAPSPGPKLLHRVARGYRRISILTAHPTKIVAELHQLAVTHLIQALDLSDREGTPRTTPTIYLVQAIRILGELDLFLDFKREPETARELMRLYQRLRESLVASCRKFDDQAIEQVLEAMVILHEGWRSVHRAG